MSNLYALLIGIDCYLPNRLPEGGYYPNLSGCVRDITHVEAYLTERLQLPTDHILKLTASKTNSTQPAEPQDQWPTYENMVAKFKQLTAMAQPGDQVYVHYSGHGGRATTIYPDLKGQDALDEALVPVDIGSPGTRYLRDVEMHKLIQDMVDKKLVLTVVLDSCHSGSATRGVGDAVARGISEVDKTPRPTDSLVASSAELLAAWQGAGGAARAVQSTSGWLLEPQGYTFFAACRASESAYEYPFDGRESNGALTYWLLDSLRQAGANFSYKMLYDRILGKVHGRFDQQTPQLQGDGNRSVFGSDQIQPYYAVPVLAIDGPGGRVRLNAGQVHGIQMGAQFALYPNGTTNFSRADGQLALADVTQVNAVDCWAKLEEQNSQAKVEEGAQAVLLNTANVRLQQGVAVVIDDAALKQALETAINTAGKGFVALAGADVAVDFQVAVNAQNEYEIWDPAGKAIANLRPAVLVSAPDAATKIVQRLIHLTKYRNVQTLDVPDPSLRQKLKVEVVNANEAEASSFHPGDKVKVKITNTQSPGAINDPALILNITVLDLGSDWGITQIYPAAAGSFEPVDPGETKTLALDAYLPEGYKESVDTLKIFATQATTQFQWLALPALDQPPLPTATRKGIGDPLAQMLAIITDETATTRALRLTNAPQDIGWTVAQVELRVQ